VSALLHDLQLRHGEEGRILRIHTIVPRRPRQRRERWAGQGSWNNDGHKVKISCNLAEEEQGIQGSEARMGEDGWRDEDEDEDEDGDGDGDEGHGTG
jgi:hypothetical protein